MSDYDESNWHNSMLFHRSGLVAQWITRLPTEQKIPGSSPGELDFCHPQFTNAFVFIITPSLK